MEILAKYGIQQTFYFPLIDAGTTDLAVSADYTPAATDCRLSKDGGSWAQATNTIADETEGWSITLTAAEMQATRIHINIIDSTGAAIEDQSLVIFTGLGGQIEATAGIYVIAVDTGTTASTTTTCEADMVGPHTTNEVTADHLNGRLLLFTTGVLQGQMTDITDYALANTNLSLTFTAMTEAAGSGDRAVIL